MPRRIVSVACALVAVAAVTAPNALASAIRVTTTADTPTAPGVCTLRDAVVASNTDASVGGCAAGSGADVIQLHRGSTYTLSIPGRDEDASATGDLDVTGRLTINGKGATIDAGGVDRVLSVQETGSLDLSHITLRGGAADSSLDPGEGGALLNLGSTVLKAVTVTDNRAAEFTGGAVLNGGVLTISGSTITDNHLDLFTYGPGAGGVTNFEHGTLTMRSSTISDNESTGIDNRGDATLTQVTISGHDQSGIYNVGRLHLVNSTVSHNSSLDLAGGVGNNTPGEMWITGSTISENSVLAGLFGGTEWSGGGIVNRGTMHLQNSTISGNRVGLGCDLGPCGPDIGGGIANGGTLDANAVTIAGNQAGTAGGGLDNGGSGVVLLTNTLIAGNSLLQPGDGVDCSGVLARVSYSLIGSSDGCSIGAGVGNVTGVAPLLGPLADNGGATQTQALLAGSPAIDAGSPTRRSGCLAHDQRGTRRPQDGDANGAARCDIGAYEVAAG